MRCGIRAATQLIPPMGRQHSTFSGPDTAETVIIGGGCMGAAALYYLTRAGFKDVVLLEKEANLCMVTSAQAAGLVGQVRMDVNRVKLAMESVRTFRELQRLADESDGRIPGPGWRETGSIRIAHTDSRMQEFQRMQEATNAAGLETTWIEEAAVQAMWPALELSKTRGVLHCPTDGYLMPADLAATYQYHAKEAGGRVETNTMVTGVNLEETGALKRVTGVETNKGTLRCKQVINAAGAHAFHIAQLVDLQFPIFPVRHHYFITSPMGLQPNYPVARIMDHALYARADVNGLLCGGWEGNPLVIDPATDFTLHDPAPQPDEAHEVLHKFMEDMAELQPDVANTGMRAIMQGWPTFSPDGRFILGPTPVEGFVMAAACNAHGVSGSAGLGMHLVEALQQQQGQQSDYVTSLSPHRYLKSPTTDWSAVMWEAAKEKAANVYGTYYALQL